MFWRIFSCLIVSWMEDKCTKLSAMIVKRKREQERCIFYSKVTIRSISLISRNHYWVALDFTSKQRMEDSKTQGVIFVRNKYLCEELRVIIRWRIKFCQVMGEPIWQYCVQDQVTCSVLGSLTMKAAKVWCSNF
jgi:hypothetical protein